VVRAVRLQCLRRVDHSGCSDACLQPLCDSTLALFNVIDPHVYQRYRELAPASIGTTDCNFLVTGSNLGVIRQVYAA